MNNITTSLHKFQKQQDLFDENIDLIFKEADDKLPILKEVFSVLADQLSQIPCIYALAEALFSEEKAERIDPQGLFDVLIHILNAIPRGVIPGFDRGLADGLRVFFEYYKDELKPSAEGLTDKIRNLQEGYAYHLFLSCQTKLGPSLKTVVIYKKNADQTYDIEVFSAQKNRAKKQGGYQGIGVERSYPLLYFSHVPSEDLLCPTNDPICLHAKILTQSIENINLVEEGLLAVFNPYHSYLEIPESSYYLMNVEHAHELKSFFAFLYRLIQERTPQDEAEENFKALIAIIKLSLMMSILPSIKLDEGYKFDAKLRLLEKAAQGTARYLEKNNQNYYLYSIYHQAVGTLERLKKTAEKLLRNTQKPILTKDIQLASDQQLLMNHCQNASRQWIDSCLDEDFWLHAEKQSLIDISLFHQRGLPKSFSEGVQWLFQAEKAVRELKIQASTLLLPAIYRIVSALKFFQKEGEWKKIDHEKGLEVVKTFLFFSETLVIQAFNQNLRSSLEVQNAAVYLLLMSYQCIEAMDPHKILSQYRPSIDLYMHLTKSPYFFCGSYIAWTQRQEILAYVRERKIRKKTFLFHVESGTAFNRSNDERFAAALLRAYPSLEQQVKIYYQKLKKRISTREWLNVSLEKLLLAVLLKKEIKDFYPIELNIDHPWLEGVSQLMQIAMYVHVLGNPQMGSQRGYKDFIKFESGLSFNLHFATRRYDTLDFHDHPPFQLHDQHNLLPSTKHLHTQNQVLKRFDSENKDFNSRLLEEAASEPSLTIIYLMNVLRREKFRLKDPKIQQLLFYYIFKVIRRKKGGEEFPLVQEICEYPQVFHAALKQFLKVINPLKIIEKNCIADEVKCILDFTILLHHYAKEALRHEICSTLENYHRYFEMTLKDYLYQSSVSGHAVSSAYIFFYLLKLLQGRTFVEQDWVDYIQWGLGFQKELERGAITLNHANKFWWSQFKWEKYLEFQRMHLEVETFKNKLSLIHLDLLQMSSAPGRLESIKENILQQPEFISLFADRVKYWYVHETTQEVYFSDPLTGDYKLKNMQEFPSNLYRRIKTVWWLYVPEKKLKDLLALPQAIEKESVWWINIQDGTAMGFYKKYPEKVWMEREKEGVIRFKNGPAKGLFLELVDKAWETDPLTDPFGLHYHAYRGHYLYNQLLDNRALRVFLHLKSTGGEGLVFERKNQGFYLKDQTQSRRLKALSYEPSEFHRNGHVYKKSTVIKICGLLIEHEMPKSVSEDSLILSFQRHCSDPHSSLIFPSSLEKLEVTSQMNSIPTIEIPVDLYGFCPKLPRQILFSAYLSLIGKEYRHALRFLNSLRPNYLLDEDDRMILKWLIDSTSDAHDHSSLAAAVKLKAYAIWIEQGLSIYRLDTKVLPSETLEEVFLVYLQHLSSIPHSLKLDKKNIHLLLEKGLSCFPPKLMSEEQWKDFKQNLLFDQLKLSYYAPPQHSKKSLLDQWKVPARLQNLKIQISLDLIEGVFSPSERPLEPGECYPEVSFGIHYMKLQSPDYSFRQKWELIYLLETMVIPEFLKASLKIAFSRECQAEPLPKNQSWSYSENSAYCESWFKKNLEMLSEQQEEQRTCQELVIHHNSLFPHLQRGGMLDGVNQAIKDLKRVSPYAYLQELRLNCISLRKNSPAQIKSPFLQEGIADTYEERERESYQKEFQEGVKLLNQHLYYQVPSEGALNTLNQWLITYSLDSVDKLKNNILQIANRRPLNPSTFIEARLAEIRENKTDLSFEDILHTIFLSGAERLRFFKIYNPYFEAEDLQGLDVCLKEYLEWMISDKILNKIKINLPIILKSVDKETFTHPPDAEIEQLWQEIAHLIDIEGEYSEDPESYMQQLFFEYLCGFRIRKDQMHLIQQISARLISKDKKGVSLIFQMIMGGGKTSVVLAFVAKLAAQVGWVPLFVVHHSQYASIKANLVNTQYKRLYQDVVDIEFKPEDLSNPSILQYLYQQLIKAENEKLLILIPSQLLLALRQEFIRQFQVFTDLNIQDPLCLTRIKELSLILHFIKMKGLLLGDEIDLILNILDEINYPEGVPMAISKESLAVIKCVYGILGQHTEISSTLNLIEDNQCLVSKKRLLASIFPKLVDAFIHEYPLVIDLIPSAKDEEYRKCLIDYMLDRIDARLMKDIDNEEIETFLDQIKINDLNERDTYKSHWSFLNHLKALKTKGIPAINASLHAISLMKELCAEVLPITLGKGFNHQYGISSSNKIVPYYGVDTPNSTEFGNIYVTACCYFQGCLKMGVTVEKLMQYRDELREASLHYAELYHLSPKDTPPSQHFKNLTGLYLHEAWDSKVIDQSLQEMNESPQVCLDFYEAFSSKSLFYHPSLLNCGAASLAQMGKWVGCSGTLWNKDTFDIDLANQSVLQKGVEGKIIAKLTQDLSNGKSHLIPILKETPVACLEAILSQRGVEGVSRLRALIDGSGFFKRYSNLAVAQEILHFKPLEKEIDGVIFLLKKEQKKEYFYVLDRGQSAPVRLNTTSRDELERMGYALDRLFIYFDELRATGSDIPFKSDGLALLTFNPQRMNLRSVLQSLLRARLFFFLQQVDIVTQEQTLESFYGYDEERPLACLQARNFFMTALRNQVEMKQIQLFQSYLSQARETYASAIIYKVAKNWVESNREEWMVQDFKIMDEARGLFYTSFVDDPLHLFFYLKEERNTFEIFQEHLDKLSHLFHEKCAFYFNQTELEDLEGTQKKLSEKARELLIWSVKHSPHQNRLHSEVQTTIQLENRKEVHSETENQFQQELQKYRICNETPPAAYIEWKKIKNPVDSFWDYQSPQIISFPQLLRRLCYEVPYDQIFPDHLTLTENLARTYEQDLPIFHPSHKQVEYLLLTKEKNVYRTLFVDLKEASFWRHEIKNHALKDCWLCDLDGSSLNEGHSIPLDAMKIIKSACWWGYFFNGKASVLCQDLDLCERELAGQALKLHFLHMKATEDPLERSILTTHPLFTNKTVDASTNLYGLNQESIIKKIQKLDKQELNQLPFYYSRYFSKDQVEKINGSGFFAYLPPEKFLYVKPAQVPLIPNLRLKYLSLPEQILAVPPEKIKWLKGPSVHHVLDAHLYLINPEEFVHLSPEKQKFYQETMIDRMGLETFAKTARPTMAPALLPKCVPFISDDCLAHLHTCHQLEKVSLEKYHLLRASQFHLLPPDRWIYLGLKDLQKYCFESVIPLEAKNLIQFLPDEWLSELDPRLAKYFSARQVKLITHPQPIPYLEKTQLEFLTDSLASYLEPHQIAWLDRTHLHLIKNLQTEHLIQHLQEGLYELSVKQIQLIKDKKILRKLPKYFCAHLTPSQILSLEIQERADQQMINFLTAQQLENLEIPFLICLLPYLNKQVLPQISSTLFKEILQLPTQIISSLTPLQLQTYLNAQKENVKNLTFVLRHMMFTQWRGLDHLFMQTFFIEQSASVIKCIPKYKLPTVPDQVLLKWYGAEGKDKVWRDRLLGFFALIFFPLIFLKACMQAFLVKDHHPALAKYFARRLLSPLRFIARTKYYRLLNGLRTTYE